MASGSERSPEAERDETPQHRSGNDARDAEAEDGTDLQDREADAGDDGGNLPTEVQKDGRMNQPCLYDDIEAMINLSDLAYELIVIRQAARDGKIAVSSANRILRTPFSLGALWDVIRENGELIRKLRENDPENDGGGESIAQRADGVDDEEAGNRSLDGGDPAGKGEASARAVRFDDGTNTEGKERSDGRQKLRKKKLTKKKLTEAGAIELPERYNYRTRMMVEAGVDPDSVEFLEVDDENHTTEMVYFITVNRCRRRVTLAFRGSSSLHDWMTDFKMTLKEVESPVRSNNCERACHQRRKGASIQVHAGMHKYLFDRERSVHSGGDEEIGGKSATTKFDFILNCIVNTMKEHEGYKLYVTGHSLGAGLATLFSFFAAAAASDHPASPLPITCIIIGTPKVGNLQFKRAFEILEQRGKIMQLRLVNSTDPICRMPLWDPVGSCCICYNRGKVYRHVGMRLYMTGRRPSVKDTVCRWFNPFWWVVKCMLFLKHGPRKPPEYVMTYRRAPSRIKLFFVDAKLFVTYWVLFAFLFGNGPKSARFHRVGEYRERFVNKKEEFEGLDLKELYDLAMGGREILKAG